MICCFAVDHCTVQCVTPALYQTTMIGSRPCDLGKDKLVESESVFFFNHFLQTEMNKRES